MITNRIVMHQWILVLRLSININNKCLAYVEVVPKVVPKVATP